MQINVPEAKSKFLPPYCTNDHKFMTKWLITTKSKTLERDGRMIDLFC